jgi:hypothetical protein
MYDINEMNMEELASSVDEAMQLAGLDRVELFIRSSTPESIKVMATSLRGTEWYNMQRRENTDFDVAESNEGASQELMDEWVVNGWLFDMSYAYTFTGSIPSPNDSDRWE